MRALSNKNNSKIQKLEQTECNLKKGKRQQVNIKFWYQCIHIHIRLRRIDEKALIAISGSNQVFTSIARNILEDNALICCQKYFRKSTMAVKSKTIQKPPTPTPTSQSQQNWNWIIYGEIDKGRQCRCRTWLESLKYMLPLLLYECFLVFLSRWNDWGSVPSTSAGLPLLYTFTLDTGSAICECILS